jgi:hypothetical protein
MLRRPLLSAVATVGLHLFAQSARAEDAPPALREHTADFTPAGAEIATSWYGWQPLIADGGSAALFSLALATDSTGAKAPFAFTGLVAFGLGGPVVHAVHGRWRTAAADLGLRVGAVALGSVLGYAIGNAMVSPPPPCTLVGLAAVACTLAAPEPEVIGLLTGATIGAVAASAIDAAVLSRENVRPPRDGQAAAFTWAPTIAPRRDGVSAGVMGTF